MCLCVMCGGTAGLLTRARYGSVPWVAIALLATWHWHPEVHTAYLGSRLGIVAIVVFGLVGGQKSNSPQ